MRQNKDYLYKVKRSGCWWRHPLKEVVTKSCREITECGHVENARKKYYFNEFKTFSRKDWYDTKTWYELIKSEKVGLLMETH